jgi:hypothetical protein
VKVTTLSSTAEVRNMSLLRQKLKRIIPARKTGQQKQRVTSLSKSTRRRDLMLSSTETRLSRRKKWSGKRARQPDSTEREIESETRLAWVVLFYLGRGGCIPPTEILHIAIILMLV